MAGTQVNYDRNTAWIGRATRQAEALTQRYPRAICGVVDAVSVGLVVSYASVYTPIALATYTSALLVYAEGTYRIERRRERDYVEPELEWTPVDWFEDVCTRAKIPVPLVRNHWPTLKGHAFDLVITDWVEIGGRPMTVAGWLRYKARLRDVAGKGCSYVAGEPDEHNGGVTEVEFQGIRLEEYIPPPEPVAPDPEPEEEPEEEPLAPPVCSIKGCRVEATHHVVDPTTPNAWVCASHVDDTVALLGGGLDWHEFDDHCRYRICTETPSADESDRKRLSDSDPLLPQRILGGAPQEGSEEGLGAVAVPGVPKRPAGAEPGTKVGRMFDLLADAQGPLRRGTLAEHAGLSPTYVDKLLTSWADIDAVERVGSLWMATTSYRSSGMFSTDGQEDDDS